jgi:1-deoxy-D-xylulose-5-phosphate reductoisomerase
MNRPQNIVVLGATGSIGTSTLDVIARHPASFRAFAVTAQTRLAELVAICRAHQPAYAVVPSGRDADVIRHDLATASPRTRLLTGVDGLVSVAAAPEADAVMAAIVGAAGLPASLAAARAGKRVLLANKEALVMAGALFMRAVHDANATLLPIDSEHNAVFQCLPPQFDARAGSANLDALGVRRILLTGSGGPFRTRALDTLHAVTPDQACAHPTWRMGRKISVDSATMMNKALEVIEACWLFGAPADRVTVVVHPQSVIHSMVEYADGSVLAQLGNPDMRTPIAQALAYPRRIDAGVSPLDLARIGALSFEPPDPVRFPALRLAYEVLEAGGHAATVFSAANEVAVAAFLEGRLAFPAITAVIERTLADTRPQPGDTLEAIIATDELARARAGQIVLQA